MQAAATVVLSALASAASFLAAFGLLLPLLFLWDRRNGARPAREPGPMRLRVIGADGTVRRLEIARDVDELMEAARRRELAREGEVTLRLHPRAGPAVRMPFAG